MPETLLPAVPSPRPSLHDLLQETIAVIPLPAPVVDPYARKRSAGTPLHLAGGYTQTFSPDGRIEFGDAYDVRRTMLNGYECIYTVTTARPEASRFIIQTFSNRGLVSRTSFSEQSEGIRKHYQRPPWSGVEGGPFSSRILEDKEVQNLTKVIRDPAAHLTELGTLASPTMVELTMLEECVAESARRHEQLLEDLRAIDEAERAAWQSSRNVIIG